MRCLTQVGYDEIDTRWKKNDKKSINLGKTQELNDYFSKQAAYKINKKSKTQVF